ncbi:hypothetical protein X975_03460, partial [Stegodyphus mimosarum]
MASRNLQESDQNLPLFLRAYRSAVRETTGYSSSHMLSVRLPCDLLFGRPLDALSSPEEYFEVMHNSERQRVNLTTKKMEYDTAQVLQNITSVLTELEQILTFTTTEKPIADDFNAPRPLWGAPAESTIPFLDFIALNNLVVINSSDDPSTFSTMRAQGWPDITLATARIYSSVHDWAVSQHSSFSDHRFLEFGVYKDSQQVIKCRWKTNVLAPHLQGIVAQCNNCNNRLELHKLHDRLINTFTQCATKS